MARKMLNETMEVAKACRAMEIDQTPIDQAKPSLTPMASKILPKANWPRA